MSAASRHGDEQGGSRRQRRNEDHIPSLIDGPLNLEEFGPIYRPDDQRSVNDPVSWVSGCIVPESLKIIAPSGENCGWNDGPGSGTFCFKLMPDKEAGSSVEPAAIELRGDKLKEAVQEYGRWAFEGGVGITLVYRGGRNIVDSVWLRVDDETEEDEGDEGDDSDDRD